MADANETLVRRMYGAFAAGDGDAMAEILAPDVVWNVPGNSRTSGSHKGQEDVFKLFALCGEISEGTMAVELESIKAVGDNTVVSTHHLTGYRSDGLRLDTHETETWTIENDRISRVDESVEDQAAADAFFA
jgi:uncharacterized protein